MSAADLDGDITQLPCGCQLSIQENRSGERALVFVPCRQTCPWYRYLQDECERQNKTIVTIDAR